MADKETQRKLELLKALQSGGVENWDGYDLATEDYRNTIGREETAENIISEIFEIICEYIEEPAGRGCGYGVRDEAYDVAVGILLRRAMELKYDKT